MILGLSSSWSQSISPLRTCCPRCCLSHRGCHNVTRRFLFRYKSVCLPASASITLHWKYPPDYVTSSRGASWNHLSGSVGETGPGPQQTPVCLIMLSSNNVNILVIYNYSTQKKHQMLNNSELFPTSINKLSRASPGLSDVTAVRRRKKTNHPKHWSVSIIRCLTRLFTRLII